MLHIKNLFSMKDLTRREISYILDIADKIKKEDKGSIKKRLILKDRLVVLFFNEPSTRTRASFELAAKRLSANVFSFIASDSSMLKGETLIDTARTLEVMKPDLFVVRHSSSGAPYLLSKYVKTGIINAGDGLHEHPTQSLLDMMTVREKLGTLEGLSVSIVGDIMHSRVARSNIIAFKKMGAVVKVCGPYTLLPSSIKDLGVKVVFNIEDALKDADVVMMLRLQKERLEDSLIPNIGEYRKYFGLKFDHLKILKSNVVIMHPGPMNRGVEIDTEIADGACSVILDQVYNGVILRMVLLCLLLNVEI